MEDHRQPQGEEQDFSFPSIVANSPCSIDSPTWLYSPSKPTILQGRRDKYIESRVKEEEPQEEKMDMLWEEFNDDLRGSLEKRHSPESHGFRRGKGGGRAVSSPAKRPGALAFVKALRKLFLLRGGIAPPDPIKTRRQR